MMIDATFIDDDGTYYPVKLYAIPRIGELIQFRSFTDESEGRDPMHFYEVTQVVHDVDEATEHVERHSVKVFVKPSDDERFEK